MILYPNLGAPLKKSLMPALGFYFAVYGKDVAVARQTTIEVHQGGKVVAEQRRRPGPAGRDRPHPARGHAAHQVARVRRLHAQGLVSDGKQSQSRVASFSVTE